MSLLLEASAPKVGNVHPGADFQDMTFSHFVATATAVQSVFAELETANAPAIGQLVLDAVRTMQTAVSRNTVLGSLLLFGPIAKAALETDGCTRDSIRKTLHALDALDCQAVYQAIRVASPGGLGSRESQDVAGEAPPDLLDAMSQVAEFDAVARQYTTDYQDIYVRTLPWLDEELCAVEHLMEAICRLQLRWLAHEPDGLIVRKAGFDIALQVQAEARRVWDECRLGYRRLAENEDYRKFDAWLREEGHRLNPGTTADLIAATLLVKLLNSPSPPAQTCATEVGD